MEKSKGFNFMITKEKLNKMVSEYFEARKRYYKIKYKLRDRIDAVTRTLNSIGCDIGDLECPAEEFDMFNDTVVARCSRPYYCEYDTESMSFPVDYLLYDPLNKDGSPSDEWENIIDLEDERIKKQKEKEAEEKRIRLEKEKKERRKMALLNKKKKEEKERAEYERLKKKFEKQK